MTATVPTKGLEFYHSRVLDSMRFDGKSRQLYRVTKVAAGMAYYRAVYDYGERIALGGSVDCCPIEQFSRWCAQVVN